MVLIRSRAMSGKISLTLFLACLAWLLALSAGPAGASIIIHSIIIPGTANPYLAGMPNGTLAQAGDSAPANSPVLVNSFDLEAGSWFEIFNATGQVANSHTSDGYTIYNWTAGPEGTTNYQPWHQSVDANDANDPNKRGIEFGKSNICAPLDSLVGVFLADDVDLGATPATSWFDKPDYRDYPTLNPLLQQVFFIGDGLTSELQQQRIYTPPGATRLYLGVMDGYEWNNNEGFFSIDVRTNVPEPATAGTLLIGSVLALIRARRKKA